MQHYPFPSGLFNHTPQSHRLEHTSMGDYTFSNNVVPEALRVVNQGSYFYKPPALAVGLLTFAPPLSRRFAASDIDIIPHFGLVVNRKHLSNIGFPRSLRCFLFYSTVIVTWNVCVPALAVMMQVPALTPVM